MKKKTLFALLLMGLFCLHASADDSLHPLSVTVEVDGVWYDLNMRDLSAVVIHGESEYKGEMTIPETVNYDGCTFEVVSIGESAFEGYTELRQVNIPQTVNTISAHAFSGCTGLEHIVLPASMGSIGSYAFSGCTSLSSISIPGLLKSIGKGCFMNCTGLKEIVFSRPYKQSITIMEEAFAHCTALETVNIPWSVYHVSDHAFEGCTALKRCVLGGMYTGNEKDYNSKISVRPEAFLNCVELTDVYLLVDRKNAGRLMVSNTAFSGCYPEYATLHCDRTGDYDNVWDYLGFGTITDLSDTVWIRKCAAPVVSYRDGVLDVSCATEGATLSYSISSQELTLRNVENYYNNWPNPLAYTCSVTVWASGGGYDFPSEMVTTNIVWKEHENVVIQTP